MTQPQSGRWVHFDTEVTNSNGRVSYIIPDSKKLPVGVYPIKMIVRCVKAKSVFFQKIKSFD